MNVQTHIYIYIYIYVFIYVHIQETEINMTIGIDTVWLQLLRIPDIVFCISHLTCWEPQLAECGALRDRIPHQGRSHQMQKKQQT